MVVEVVSTGIPTLDKELLRGLPKGFTMLVYGSPGSGMELFAKQFAQAGVGLENTIYFSTIERTEDVQATMKAFGWSTDFQIVNLGTIYYETVLARQLEISRYRQEGVKMSDIKAFTQKSEEKESQNFLTQMTYEISKLKPPFRVVIDSLDFFLEHYSHGEVLSALRTVKAHTQHNNSVALVTMLNNVYEKKTQSSVEGIVDCILELDTQPGSTEFKRDMLIRKFRNHPEKLKVLTYNVSSKGLTAKS